MSELDLWGMIKHLPKDHKAVLQYREFQNITARYLDAQQEVWKLKSDIERLKRK